MYQHSTLIWHFAEAKAQADKAKASEFIFCFPVSFWHIYGTTCSPCISISIAQRKAMGYGPIFWDVKVGWERIIDLAQNMERAILSLYSPNNLFWIEASTFWWRHMPKQFHGTMMIGWHRGTSLFKNFKKVTEKDLLTRRSNTCNNLEFAQERIFISAAIWDKHWFVLQPSSLYCYLRKLLILLIFFQWSRTSCPSLSPSELSCS